MRPCDSCDRDEQIVMGGRGPVRTDLSRQQVGHFVFCEDCFASADRRTETAGGLVYDKLTVRTGERAGHTWLLTVESDPDRG